MILNKHLPGRIVEMTAMTFKSAPWDDVLLLEESLNEEERMI